MATNNNRCIVCGGDLSASATICSQCGWPVMLFPNEVPASIREAIADERTFYSKGKRAKENTEAQLQYVQKELSDTKHKLEVVQNDDTLKKEIQKKDRRIEELNGELKRINTQLKDAVKESGQLRQQAKEKDISARKMQNEIARCMAEASRLKSDLQNVKCNADETLSKNRKLQEMNTIQQKEIDELKKKISSAINSNDADSQNRTNFHTQGSTSPSTGEYVSSMRGQIKGHLVIRVGTPFCHLDVREGENVYGKDSTGAYARLRSSSEGRDCFRIYERQDVYKLFDLCGKTYTATGRSISDKGTELTDGIIFKVDNLSIQININNSDF